MRESSTKRELLILLKTSQPLTVQDISERLGISGMAVRRHLHDLQKDRYVEIAFQRRNARKPVFVYRLSQRAEFFFPNGYDELAKELLDGIQDTFGDKLVNKLLDRRKSKLSSIHRPFMTGRSLDRRVAMLAQLQDRQGYMVRLERRADGSYMLEEANCPVALIASLYPQVCSCEQALFAELLEAHVERTACMAEGGAKCRYLISERSGDCEEEREEATR
ncbi:metalloregulator ArsR/SmtB family transcription factor [Paenibacillus filicis]|uniref:Metalloregulator ArsR/SmtB family transcription factor n=2 Tax=Paenibacillus filicis TaxID=669464 RepID=A0ABU9DEE4_9BACL